VILKHILYVFLCHYVMHNSIVFMIAMFKLFYNTIAACQRPVGPLLSNKCMSYSIDDVEYNNKLRTIWVMCLSIISCYFCVFLSFQTNCRQKNRCLTVYIKFFCSFRVLKNTIARYYALVMFIYYLGYAAGPVLSSVATCRI